MRVLVSSAVALSMTLVSAPVRGASNGQASAAPQGPAVTPSATASQTTTATSVFGYIWNAKNEPIAYAHVRLRNVTSGKVEATTTAAANGEFAFHNVAGGTYAIEYVDETGKILAVGHVFSVAPGETVATFIRLGTRVPWFAALFGNAGAAVVAAAASLGITAVAPPARAVSPEG
jgi:hypothetical protein